MILRSLKLRETSQKKLPLHPVQQIVLLEIIR